MRNSLLEVKTMNKKSKLLRKLNIGIMKVDLWSRVVDFALWLAKTAHEKAKKNFYKNQQLAAEMAEEDYSEDLRIQFEQISKTEL